MPEKLKRILQNKNWRSWKKSDWLLLALAGILLLVIALPVESGDGTAEKAYNTAQEEKETSGGSGRTASGDSGGTASGSQTSEEGEQEYVQYLEKKLENILMQMDGVGRVDVMITVSDGKIRRYTWRLQMKNIRMYRKRRCRRWQALWWSQREAGTRRRFLRFQSPCRHY